MDIKDKIRGCIFGGAIGDCLGNPYENQSNKIIINNLSWKLSDDTQMTLATCEAISQNKSVDPGIIGNTFVQWYRQSKFSGLGASTYKALVELNHGGHWALVGRKGEMSAGNGAAMRIAPLAFCLDPDKTADRVIIRDICRITHHNEEAYIGALAVMLAIRDGWKEHWIGKQSLLPTIIDRLPDSSVRDRLIILTSLDSNLSFQEISRRFGNSGYVVETVPLALYAANCVNKKGFQKILEELVGVGGDTDTIASIAGQIIGVAIGYNALPKEMINHLPDLHMITNITDAFIAFLTTAA